IFFIAASGVFHSDSSDNVALEALRSEMEYSIKLHPDLPFPQASSVYVALREGRITDAVDLANQFLANVPPDTFLTNRLMTQWGLPSIYLYVPLSKMLAGQYQAALDSLGEQLSSGGSANPFMIGLAQCNLGNYDDAKRAFIAAENISNN